MVCEGILDLMWALDVQSYLINSRCINSLVGRGLQPRHVDAIKTGL